MRRRAFLGALAGLATFPAQAMAPDRSRRPPPRPGDALLRAVVPADQLVAQAGLGGAVSAVVADATTGAVLERVNPIRALPPASVLKAVTALYALETLGAGHRFETRLVATGPVRAGRLEGDLALVGGGDPSLDTDGLHALAVAAREAGLREVAGRFLVSNGGLPLLDRIDPGQPEHVGYNPAVAGLSLNYNRVHFEWRPGQGGHATTMEARTGRFRPAVDTSRMRIDDRAAPTYTFGTDGTTDRWTVARRQLGGSGARWLPVRNPDLYAGDVMRTMLRSNGIVVPAAERATGIPKGAAVAAEAGAPLDAVARAMLRHSTNLTAELIGLSASRARGLSDPTLARSAAAMADWMAGRCEARPGRLDDHSGLNGTSRMSGLDMVRLLTAPGAADRLRPILRDMTVQGRPRVPDTVDLDAKTGTLNFASGLGGYFEARSGRPLAFAVFAADPPPPRRPDARGARAAARRPRLGRPRSPAPV